MESIQQVSTDDLARKMKLVEFLITKKINLSIYVIMNAGHKRMGA